MTLAGKDVTGTAHVARELVDLVPAIIVRRADGSRQHCRPAISQVDPTVVIAHVLQRIANIDDADVVPLVLEPSGQRRADEARPT